MKHVELKDGRRALVISGELRMRSGMANGRFQPKPAMVWTLRFPDGSEEEHRDEDFKESRARYYLRVLAWSAGLAALAFLAGASVMAIWWTFEYLRGD